MPGTHATDGSLNVTVVTGTSTRGLYAADGSINVILADGTKFGATHPNGAWLVTVSTGHKGSQAVRAPDGSLYVSETPFTHGGRKVTVVSGSFSGGGASTAGTPIGLLLALTRAS